MRVPDLPGKGEIRGVNPQPEQAIANSFCHVANAIVELDYMQAVYVLCNCKLLPPGE